MFEHHSLYLLSYGTQSLSRLSPVSWLWEHSKEGRDYIKITHPRPTLVPPAALAICLGAGAVLPDILQQPSGLNQ